MLSGGIPARWPRVFSAIGLGGTGILFVQRVPAGYGEVPLKFGETDFESAILQGGALPIFIFFALIVGEVCIFSGRVVASSFRPSEVSAPSMRIAKVVEYNRPMLSETFVKSESFSDLFYGLGLLSLFAGGYLTYFMWGLIEWLSLILTVTGFIGARIFWLYAWDSLAEFDKVLLALRVQNAVDAQAEKLGSARPTDQE
ncbi:MAG: hypothetical protein ACPGGK_10560 [Pikeienuella sp.]